MKNIYIDGISISEFTIINKSLGSLDTLKDGIREKLGIEMNISEEMIDGGHYIIADGSELIVDKFSITTGGGNVVIKGSTRSLDTAIKYFCENYLEGKTENYFGSIGRKETYTKDQLWKLINKVYADPDKVIIGEQVCGNPKGPYNISESIELFRDATKKMPGIMGIDLGCYGLALPHCDDATWSSFICDIVDFVSEGGIITASAHWENPSGYETDYYNSCRGQLGDIDTVESYEKEYTNLITEGTELNRAFMREIEADARFFAALKDNGVPIIWRPLHEANGDWFWFCVTQREKTVDPKYIIAIWHYIYKYFTEKCGLDNLIWCYSPNISSNPDDIPGRVMSVNYVYPGDEYCDMVGIDWYTGGELELAESNNFISVTEHSKKPGAICEFGTGGAVMAEDPADQASIYSSMSLYNDLLALKEKGHSFVYVLTWYNRWNIKNLSRGDELMATDMTMGMPEVKAMFDSLK